jgi:SRSO17 transposase
MRTDMERCCSIANCICMRIGRRTPSAERRAGVPEERRKTIPKPTLAKQMLARAFAHGVKVAWVTCDTVYGGDYKLRSWLEARLQPYGLAVPKNQRIGRTHRADEVVASWQASRWQRVAAGEGSQGPRLYDWAWQSLDFRWTEPGWKQWLLARRSLSDPSEIAYYFVFAPESMSLKHVVQAAGSRWQVEEAFELAKQQVGLDEYEVRHWQGWYRHITLAMFALAFLTVVKVAGQKRGPNFRSKKSLNSFP